MDPDLTLASWDPAAANACTVWHTDQRSRSHHEESEFFCWTLKPSQNTGHLWNLIQGLKTTRKANLYHYFNQISTPVGKLNPLGRVRGHLMCSSHLREENGPERADTWHRVSRSFWSSWPNPVASVLCCSIMHKATCRGRNLAFQPASFLLLTWSVDVELPFLAFWAQPGNQKWIKR